MRRSRSPLPRDRRMRTERTSYRVGPYRRDSRHVPIRFDLDVVFDNVHLHITTSSRYYVFIGSTAMPKCLKQSLSLCTGRIVFLCVNDCILFSDYRECIQH
jgi:hypothetical protein